MAITRLGWDVFTSSSNPRLKSFPWVSGKVRNGDHYVVLDYFCRRYNAEVETIRRDWSWGWSYRAVRGASVVSEHSAGTAIDLNAPKHPLGTNPGSNYSAAQIKAIKGIISDLDNVIRWGGTYAGRKDPMHYELQGGNAAIKRVADRIRGGNAKPASGAKAPVKTASVKKTTTTKKAATSTAAKQPTNFSALTVDGTWNKADVKALQIVLRAIKAYTRAVDGDFGPYTVKGLQTWLHKLGYYKRAIDGERGYYTILALQQFLRKKGHYTKAYLLDGKFGPATIKAFTKYLNSQRG